MLASGDIHLRTFLSHSPLSRFPVVSFLGHVESSSDLSLANTDGSPFPSFSTDSNDLSRQQFGFIKSSLTLVDPSEACGCCDSVLMFAAEMDFPCIQKSLPYPSLPLYLILFAVDQRNIVH